MLLETVVSDAGIKREYHYDDDLGYHALIIHDDKQLQESIDMCKSMQNNYDTAANKLDIRLVASIPEDVYMAIIFEAGIRDMWSEEAANFAKREFLLNPKWRYCRTVPDNWISHEALKR